jgi:putative serine protease PepD
LGVVPESPPGEGETGPNPNSEPLERDAHTKAGDKASIVGPAPTNGTEEGGPAAPGKVPTGLGLTDIEPVHDLISPVPGVGLDPGSVLSTDSRADTKADLEDGGGEAEPAMDQTGAAAFGQPGLGGGVEEAKAARRGYGQNPYVQQGYGPVRYAAFEWQARDPKWAYQTGYSQPRPARPPKKPPRYLPGWLGLAIVSAVVGAVVGGGLVAVFASRASKTIVREYFPGKNGRVQVGDIQSILASVLPAVVSIDTSHIRGIGGNGGYVQGAGTGMIIEPSGVILTNNHVIAGAQTVTVTFYGQTKQFPAKVIGVDPQEDIALVQVEGTRGSLPVVHLGNSNAAQQGDGVLAIGNALALAGGETVTQGIVSALNRSLTATTDEGTTENLSGLIQTDAPINPGNSGGPLVDASGQVVAMNTAVATSSQGNAPAQNVGFAIAVDEIRAVVTQILHHPIRP